MRQRFVRRHPSEAETSSPPALYPRILRSSLEIEREITAGGHTVLRPIGELEATTVPMFRQAVAEIGSGQDVIVDMARLVFLDSCGIGALIGAVRRTRELGGTIALAAVRPPVARALDLTGTNRIVTIMPTVEGAMAFLDGSAGKSRAFGHRIAI